MTTKQCEGITASGSQCKRRVKTCERYCALHNVSTNIALPSYVSVTPEDRFWVFFPEEQSWKVGSEHTTKLFCPGSGASYDMNNYVSEGSYGAVYFGKRLYDNKSVAIKIFKEIFRKESKRPAVKYDFMKEFYMHRAVADRVTSECVVKMIDSFFLRTKTGLHGCIVMEKMDGSLIDMFEGFEQLSSKLQLEIIRIWTLSLKSVANALIDLHCHKIYHLDIKPGNVLYARIPDGNGIVMKLVDFGLSCYLGGTPIVPCVATGSYLPLEWRNNGDKREPTYERVRDPVILEMGEIYAMCVSFHKILKPFKNSWMRGNRNFNRLLYAIECGMSNDRSLRFSVTPRTFVNLTDAVLDELKTILPPQFQGVNLLFS